MDQFFSGTPHTWDEVRAALREAGYAVVHREPPIKNGDSVTDGDEHLFRLCRDDDYEGLWAAMLAAAEGDGEA